MNKTKNTTKRVRSATVFALVEGLIILLFIVLGAANLFFTNGTANRRTRQLVEDSYRGQIDNLTNDIRNVSLAGFSLMSNETVVRLKSYYFDKIQHDSYARNAAINSTMAALLSLTTYYDILDSCALWIAPDGELSYNTLYTFVGDDTRREMLDAEIAAHRYSPTYDENLHNRNGKVFISLSLSETDHAVLAMMLNTDYLTKALSLPVLPQLETAAYAADGDRLCIVCSDDKDPLTALTDRTATDKPILEKGKVVYRTDVLGAIPLYTSFRTAAVDTNLPLYTVFFITACVLLCGAALVLFITFRHFFNKPYAKLLGAMNEVSRGNFDVRLDDKISSDFQYIYDGFNYMTSSVSGYIEENYRQKVMRTESEFKALQAQINPHFLYNCFANIRSFCKMGDIESVALMTENLSKLFLYITRNAAPIVPLCNEAENLQNYLQIQQMRFGDRVLVEVQELPEEFRDVPIPKLCLQPIAENAYKYAFADKDSGGIFRVGYAVSGNELSITLEDNGDVSDRQIAEIARSLTDAAETSGIVNVSRRLRHYADGYGRVEVTRSSLGGLCVTLRLNIGKRGDADDNTGC
ncbi:MAG: histidine kinase [Eubacteriales bacterium]|nr:histidine kinase [Eubacteriales bacterium]